METKALLVLDTWSSAAEFKTDLINTMKSNGLNIITDFEATDIVLALNYMTSLIYSYYKNYYLSNASKERTLELMSITASGKLNFYASQLKAYKDAYAHDFKSLGGNENSSSHDTTLNRSGKSKQATTPETIAKGSDYIDDYSSSEQKYENSNKETGTRSYNSTIKGSEQDYWKNIISIPKRLFEDIIGSFSKFFFSSSMELTPCAVLTIEQAIQKLKDEIKALGTTTSTEINSLKSLIKINQEEIKDLKTSVDTLVTAGENTDNRVTTLENQTGDIQRNIDKTNTTLENLTKVTPTDIGVKDNKLGLKHDTNWLTNQDAINLGDNLIYDDTTKTLNAKGGSEGNDLTLNLYDYENDTSRATLTPQEKKNWENGRYATIFCHPNEEQTTLVGTYAPAVVYNLLGSRAFFQYSGVINESDGSLTLTKVTTYSLNIQETPDSSGNYPFTYENNATFNFNSSEDTLLLVTTTSNKVTITQEQYNNIRTNKYKFIYLYFNNVNIPANDITIDTNSIEISFGKVESDNKSSIISTLTYTWTSSQLESTPTLTTAYFQPQGKYLKYTYFTESGSLKTITLGDVSTQKQYFSHNGIISVGDNYVMIEYISTDSTKITDLNQLITKLMGNYITASGSFMLGSGLVAMVYGIDFGQNVTLFNCNILDFNLQAITSDDISLSDVEIKGYNEKVRLIQ